jgi:iron-sulfur cluster assembly protein
VREFIAAEEMPAESVGLRIGVMPGGCSGFKYEMSIDESAAADDVVLDLGGVRVFVDPFSAQYLNGVTVDYVSTMQSQGFAFENPNATGGCGCGTSFSV